MKTIIISYDEEIRIANVIDTENCIFNELSWDNDFEIDNEQPSSDCEDFNDNARWLIKALLAILKLEKEDDMAHCDWTADSDKGETGEYKFEVSIKKIKELEK